MGEEQHGRIAELQEQLRQGKITRREFLRCATLVGLSVGTAQALAGCAPTPEPPTPEPPTAVPPTPVPPTPVPALPEAPLALEDLPAYRVKDIYRVELVEGTAAFTGSPEPGKQSEMCSGCASCEAICSLGHEGQVSRVLSGIKVNHHVVEWMAGEPVQLYSHNICRQCPGIPACAAVCPVDCIYRDEKTGAVLIDHDTCIRCQLCVDACPYDACGYSPQLDKIVKCDLCHDNADGPQCVSNCPLGVLQLVKVA